MRLKELTSVPIEQGGGKLEVSRKLAEEGFPVPKSAYLYYSDLERRNLVRAAFKQLRKPVIVRGSHANDWEGYIDVLPTRRDVVTEDQLFDGIKEIKQCAASKELEIHSRDWGQPFTAEVHVLLQEQSPSPLSGSMLRHPHVLDEVHVNYVDRVKYANHDSISKPTFSFIRKDNRVGIYHGGVHSHPISKGEIDRIFETYAAIEKSGFFRPEWVYQMEIGLDPFMIYQLRPFKKKEPAKDFKVPFTINEDFPSLRSDLCFGITPSVGIELSLLIMNPVDFYLSFSGDNKPYSLLLTDKQLGTVPTTVQIKNLVAYFSRARTHSYLEHGEFRFLRRARYSFLNWYSTNVSESGLWKYYANDLEVFRESRLWSNGNSAVLIPAEYAKAEIHEWIW